MRALDAAEALFAARGPRQVSVRDIAAATGVSHALLHRYLGGKDDIVGAVFARHASLIREAGEGCSDLRVLTGAAGAPWADPPEAVSAAHCAGRDGRRPLRDLD